jgi:hypothetical protein
VRIFEFHFGFPGDVIVAIDKRPTNSETIKEIMNSTSLMQFVEVTGFISVQL